MITAEEWWGILGAYNTAIFPMQIITIIVAAILTYFLFTKPGTKTNSFIKAYLAFTFAWIGIVFYLILGKGLTGNYLWASLFIIIAILFVVDISAKRIEFRIPKTEWQKYLTIFLILCTFSYPLIGMLLGHYYPKMVILGTFPCPTTAFALALLAAAIPKVDKKVYILLLFWAIPLPMFAQIPRFGVYEDSIMLVIGIYSLIMLVKNWKIIGKELNE